MEYQKVEEFFVPALEEELTEIKHLLAEPESDHISLNGILCCEKDDQKNFFGAVDVHPEPTSGWLDSNTMQGGQTERNISVLDGLDLHVDEDYDLYASNDLSIPCEDFLHEIVAKLNCLPCEASTIRNARMIPIGNSGSKSNCQSQIPLEVKIQPPDPQVISMSKNCAGPLESDVLTGKISVKSTPISLVDRQRRMRKPSLRYIEELSNSVSSKTRREELNTVKDENLKTGICDDAGHCAIQSSDGSDIQLSSQSRSRRERPWICASLSELESQESSSDEKNEAECIDKKISKKTHNRRRPFRTWDISEVIKLVDGVAQHGVGKWTKIKRSFFPSSTHRSTVDLRDKWRNLQKVSSASLKRKREMKNHPAESLPESVLQRIAELDKINPFPRNRKTKLEYSSRKAAPCLSGFKSSASSVGGNNA